MPPQTPTKWRSGGHLPSFDFDVTIRIPKLYSEHPLRIKSLETHLPNFEHHVGDLLGAVNFDSLSLQSSNAHIFSRVRSTSSMLYGELRILIMTLQSLNVTKGNFRTTNAHIRGHYESHGNLSLQTTNSDIVADVSLFSDDPNIQNTLALRTTNA